jgi:AAHS family 3-hydroxyphenylpropionic acid transporter
VAAGRLGAILGPLVAGAMLSAGATGDQVILYMVPLVVAAGGAMFVLSRAAGDRLAVPGLR